MFGADSVNASDYVNSAEQNNQPVPANVQAAANVGSESDVPAYLAEAEYAVRIRVVRFLVQGSQEVLVALRKEKAEVDQRRLVLEPAVRPHDLAVLIDAALAVLATRP